MTEKRGADPFRAARQFERFLGVDVNAPGEERMTQDEHRDYRSKQTEIDRAPDEVIATIVYNFEKGTTRIIRKSQEEIEPEI